jgi:hypothetical protein
MLWINGRLDGLAARGAPHAYLPSRRLNIWATLAWVLTGSHRQLEDPPLTRATIAARMVGVWAFLMFCALALIMGRTRRPGDRHGGDGVEGLIVPDGGPFCEKVAMKVAAVTRFRAKSKRQTLPPRFALG